MSLLGELALLVAAAAVATLVAIALGAENLGTALTSGQIAFIATVVAIVVVRRRAE